MRSVKPEDRCCGCGACAEVCPVQAITMTRDACGFVYPRIREGLCIHCGKCEKICAFGDRSVCRAPLNAYAAMGADRARNQNSASGGVFAALASSCLEQGGAVAGAVMDLDGDVRVYHLLTRRQEELPRLQGSKYVQSDAAACFQPLQAALRQGTKVLFCGTPCQVAALKKITCDPENLYTADLICHGVPPQAMLADFCEILQKRFFGRKLTGLCFRDKSTQKQFCARLEFGGRHILQRSHSLSFYDAFLRGANYRESCYSCPYACRERVGDVTLGDYWGVEKAHPQLQGQCWSSLLVNTPKGQQLVRDCGALVLQPTEPDAIAKENHQLTHPSRKAPDRELLLSNYARGGYRAVERAFMKQQGGALKVKLRAVRSWFRNTL